jgi:Carbohydrate binding module (family 6)/Pectate lyase superfamily protein
MGIQGSRSNGFSRIGLSLTQTKYKHMNTITCLFLLCFFSLSAFAQSDGLPRGAYLMPYTRYEATSTSLGGGATLLGPTFDQTKVQSEASDRICASLSAANSSVSWTTTQAGQGLVLRYSIPDGQSGTLGFYVNNTFVQSINVTTKWSWQYFAKPGQGDPNLPSNTPNPNATQRMRFDEVRVFLANSIPAGATVTLQKGSDDITYMVDFIELEPIPQAVAFNPATMRSVTEFGAVPNDGRDDLSAFNGARIALQNSGRSLYIPAGTFNLGSAWHIESNISIQGAGIWYTTLYFTSTGSGGIVGNGDNIQLRDFYMNGENTTRTEYKGLTGGYGNNSIIERLWIEHFETGAWITTWTGTITNGLRVSFCRFRNNYADGINLTRGSSNCIVEQCNMRNNGDDAMATWSAFDGPQQCFNNEFKYCTAENTWRAGGIGFFGGGGHKGHHLLIKDSTENGIRINSDFPTVGSSFSSTLWIEVYETTVIGCGTNANLWHNRYGAVDIFTRLYNVQNFRLRNVDIQGSQKDAVMIYDVASAFRISNIEFINVTLNGAGLDGNINNYTPGTYDDYAGYGIYVLPDTDGSMTITNTNICNTPSGQTRNDSGATFAMNGTPGSTCSGNTNNAPVANAGPDQNLSSGTTSANLSGSATDGNGDPITFSWSQISGPTATITNSSSANTSVTGLSSGNTYVFRLSASDGEGGTGTDDVQITVQSPSTQNPFPGPSPAAIPGTIEFENFDTGGEGVAYHDNEAANQGGQGRTAEGVDTEICSEGGLNIGWTATGEWYEYTVNVATTGSYNIDVRAASMFAGGAFHIEFNGVDKTGLFTTTNTNGWQNWTTISKANIPLTAGVQVMRVFLDNANFNLDKITFTKTDTATSYRIKNRWQNTYLYDAGDRVRYSATASGTAYNWALEDVGGGRKEIKNVSTGEYMHIENLTGYVQCTARTVGWMSSRWTIVDAGSGFVRLRNVWQSSNYIHVENLAGHAQHGTIYPVWESAQWVLEPVSGGSVAMGGSAETEIRSR